MARFLHHEPCPACGSRDNLGRYDDGSAYCFGGCGYFEKPTHAPRRDYTEAADKDEDNRSYAKIPEDSGRDFPQVAVDWLAKYDVGLPEAISRSILWSNNRQQLIFDMENIWQARNFNPEAAAKRKYFTQGDVNGHLPVYKAGDANKARGLLVLVEDCMSAIKIARQCDSMPLLGSHLSPIKLNRLVRLYSRLIVWLDADKLKEAQGISTRARWLGLDSRSVYSENDPKEYSNFMIANFLRI